MTNQSVDQAVMQKSVEGMICVTLEVHLWSGRKRLKKDALVAINPEFEKLPPETLATLGAIKICDPDDLSPFLRLKREAEKILAQNGLPLLGTTGIPEAKLESVYHKLIELKTEFDANVDEFHKRFNDAIYDWRTQEGNSKWGNLISDIPTPEHVAGKLSFGFHLCRVSAPSSDEFSAANAMYANQMTGLKGELFADAAREANILMANYLTGQDATGVVKKREKVTWKTLRPIKRIAEKLKSFAFLDPTVEPLANMIEHVLKLLPVDGPIDGVHLMHVWTISQALSTPAKAMEVGQMAFAATTPADAFELMLGASAQNDLPAGPQIVEQLANPVASTAVGVNQEQDYLLFAEDEEVVEKSPPQPVAAAEQPVYTALF